MTAASICTLTEDEVHTLIRIPGQGDHKYTRGVVGIVAGSATYPGAGVLAVLGAQAAGPGMVRLDAPERVQNLVIQAAPGVVLTGGRIQAALVGPGMGADTAQSVLELALFAAASHLPLIIDAGAFTYVPQLLESGIGQFSVLTPHAGEAAALLRDIGTEDLQRSWVEDHPVDAAVRLAQLTGARVLLKGSQNVLGTPEGAVILTPPGMGWTGVAGAGDVLAGFIAGLAASWQAECEAGLPQRDFDRLIAAGALIHAKAGRMAAMAHGPKGAPISALDIARTLPAAFGHLLAL